MARSAEPVVDRFHRMYTKRAPYECWEWNFSLSTNGYGRILIDGKSRIASRVAYELQHGMIDRDLCVLHSCDYRACVNPAHLRLGTLSDNSRDMYDRFRFPKQVMTPEMREKAASMLLSGASQKDVAAAFGVGKGSIHHISRDIVGIIPARGYSWHKRDRRFAASIRLDGKRVHLGNFLTAAEARAAYEAAFNNLHGKSANIRPPNGGRIAGASHPSAILSPGAQ